jgi:hypothetical protein
MRIQDRFKGERLQQVNKFVASLTSEFKALSLKEIEKDFFNNSRSFREQCISFLEGSGIIEINRPISRSYVNGRWVTNSNLYRLTVESDKKDTAVVYEFNGELIVIDKVKDVKRFNECLKITHKTFGSIFKSAVIGECLISGFSEAQAEKLWNEYEKFKQNNKQVI